MFHPQAKRERNNRRGTKIQQDSRGRNRQKLQTNKKKSAKILDVDQNEDL